MVNFMRGIGSKKALNIGSERYYRDLWDKEIAPHNDKLNYFVNTRLPTWHSTDTDFKTGYWKVWGQGENMERGDLLLQVHLDDLIKLVDDITIPQL